MKKIPKIYIGYEMKLFKIIIICSLVNSFAIFDSYSQSNVSVPILIEPPDARSAAMGCVGTASANDIYATYWNPGGLGFLKQTLIPDGLFADESENDTTFYFEGAISNKLLPLYNNSNISYWNLAVGANIESFGTLALDYSIAGYGEMTRTHESGIILGKFSTNEFYVGLAWGFLVSDDWGLGIKGKYIQSNIIPPPSRNYPQTDYWSYAFDLGVLWKPKNLNIGGLNIGDALSLGATLKNIGPKINYLTETEPLPSQMRFGACFDLSRYGIENLRLAFDISKLLVYRTLVFTTEGSDTFLIANTDPLPKSLISGWKNPGLELGIGAEYWYENFLAFRAGYNTEPTYQGNRKIITFGGSFRLNIVQGDVSYNYATGDTKYLTNVLRFTLRVGGYSN